MIIGALATFPTEELKDFVGIVLGRLGGLKGGPARAKFRTHEKARHVLRSRDWRVLPSSEIGGADETIRPEALKSI